MFQTTNQLILAIPILCYSSRSSGTVQPRLKCAAIPCGAADGQCLAVASAWTNEMGMARYERRRLQKRKHHITLWENVLSIGDFLFETPSSSGFPIARFYGGYISGDHEMRNQNRRGSRFVCLFCWVLFLWTIWQTNANSPNENKADTSTEMFSDVHPLALDINLDGSCLLENRLRAPSTG